MQYCFGRSDGRLEQANFQANAYDALHHQLQAFWVLKHIRIILTTVTALPERVVMRIGGSLAQVVKNNIVRC